MKATKKQLAVSKDRMYALRNEIGNITHMDEIMKVAERFYAELYAVNVRPRDSTVRNNLIGEVPMVPNDEGGDEERKNCRRQRTTMDLRKDGGNIIL